LYRICYVKESCSVKGKRLNFTKKEILPPINNGENGIDLKIKRKD
jgi:hypothetical protein